MDDFLQTIPGLIRCVRRVADLSQRELAASLGVDQSRVARWESGEATPDVGVLAQVLRLGGYQLRAVDAGGEPARPLRSDAVRDRAGRRYPAHLDVRDTVSYSGEPVLGAPRRAVRDRARAAQEKREPGGAPVADHPTRAAVLAARRQRREERCRGVRERLAAVTAAAPTREECACLDACLTIPGCVAGCPCACEPQSVHDDECQRARPRAGTGRITCL